MSPAELSAKILAVAEYLEKDSAPSRAITASAVRTVLTEVRMAGKLTKFLDKDFEAAIHALDTLTERLSKAAKTLNPQDDARAIIENSVEGFQSLKTSLIAQFKDLSQTSI